jgi:hypothetical protein
MTYKYFWIHLPTGRRGERTVTSEELVRDYGTNNLLTVMSRWNQQQPQNWVYYV